MHPKRPCRTHVGETEATRDKTFALCGEVPETTTVRSWACGPRRAHLSGALAYPRPCKSEIRQPKSEHTPSARPQCIEGKGRGQESKGEASHRKLTFPVAHAGRR